MRALRAKALAIVAILAGEAVAASSIRVVDGNTLEVSGITYRLNGIDAPDNVPKGKYADYRENMAN